MATAQFTGRISVTIGGIVYSGDVSGTLTAAQPLPIPPPVPVPTPPPPAPPPVVGTLPAVGIALQASLTPAQGSVPAGAKLITTTLAEPVGASRLDPQFPKTSIRKLLAGGHHDYSQLQPFSPDGTLVLLATKAGAYGVYRYADMILLRQLSVDTLAPRWLPDGRILALSGQPYRAMAVTVGTGAFTTLFSSAYPYGYTSQVHEETSIDGRWTAMMGHTGSGAGLTLLAVDLVGKRLGAKIGYAELFTSGAAQPDPQWGRPEVDWLKPTPGGKFLAVQWKRDGAQRASGCELYDIETGAYVRHLHAHHNHGDFGQSVDGRDFYATTGIAHPANSNYPALIAEWVDGAPPTQLRMIEWGATAHISCRGPRGQILCTSNPAATATGAQPPLIGELWLTDISGAAVRLGHHRSTASGPDPVGYWAQPRAALSRDGKRVIFDSDWGVVGSPSVFALELG